MALQFHGILETTGHETSSAKMQHASLPKFCNLSMGIWDEEESGNTKQSNNHHKPEHVGSMQGNLSKNVTCFEAGVIRIESELGGAEDFSGYDLLPPPGPSEEHHVLNALTSSSLSDGYSTFYSKKIIQPSGTGFVYGITSEEDGSITKRNGVDEMADATLGSIKVDSDINKLREILRSMNHTLGKLHRASMIIQTAQHSRNKIQLDLLRDIDSWGDSRGEVISQRALVSGVAALENVNDLIGGSNKNMSGGKTLHLGPSFHIFMTFFSLCF